MSLRYNGDGMRNAETTAPSAGKLVMYLLPAAVAVFNLSRFLSPDFLVDDSFISLRVAENWVRDGALTFDVTRPPVEGMTNLLWTLLAAPVIAWAPAVNPATALRLAGALCYLATVLLGAAAAYGMTRSRVAASVAGCLLAFPSSLGFHALSGLETPLFALLFAAGVFVNVSERPGMAGAAVYGLALGALAATRPEGIPLGVLFLCVTWRMHGRGAFARAALPFALVLGLTEGFRYAYYGALVPNTFAAKGGDFHPAWNYLRLFAMYGLGVAGAFSAAAAAVLDRRLRGPALVALALLAGVFVTGGDWMPIYRRLIPVYIFAAFATGIMLAHRSRAARWTAAAGCVAMLGGNVAATLQHRDSGRYTNQFMQEIGALAKRTPALNRVALLDIGVFGYEFERSIYDLGALTDAHLAALPGGHLQKPWDEAYFRAQRPDAVLVTVRLDGPGKPIHFRYPEEQVMASIVKNGGYRLATLFAVAPLTTLLLVRDGVRLPSEIWGPALDVAPAKIMETLQGLQAGAPRP